LLRENPLKGVNEKQCGMIRSKEKNKKNTHYETKGL